MRTNGFDKFSPATHISDSRTLMGHLQGAKWGSGASFGKFDYSEALATGSGNNGVSAHQEHAMGNA